MTKNISSEASTPMSIHILLADDDIDDRYFFEKALNAIPIVTQLSSVVNGEKLMTYLFENSGKLPDVLFLDFNMPRKNGLECLSQIKSHEALKHLPVIIISTSMHRHLADLLYQQGAYYYVRKTDEQELQQMLHQVLTMMIEKKLVRPARDKFILSLTAV